MKISKQARRDAKDLFRACLVNGVLDESKARLAVQLLLEKKPRGYYSIAEQFKRLVKLDLDRRSAVVESAVALTPDQQESLKAALIGRYGQGLQLSYTLNPSLLGGLRVKVGSDVFDGSVLARLTQLQETF